MSERRALKQRCGPVGRLGLLGLRGIPKLSLIWRNRQQPLQHVHVQQGSLIRHGWTISFNPKIVVVQNHNHMPAGAARIEQVLATPERDRPDRQSHRVTPGVLRKTVFADRPVVSKTEESPDIERAFRSRPAKRAAELPMMQHLRKTPTRLTSTSRQRFDPPQAELAQTQGRVRRKASPLATILLEAPAKKPAAASYATWPPQRSNQKAYLPNTEPKSSREAAAIFLPIRPERRRIAEPSIQRLPKNPTELIGQTNTRRRAKNVPAAMHMQQRRTAEQVWLKSPESSNRLIEIAPGRQFTQPFVSQASHPQMASAPLAPHASAQPPLPDMNRLVDEVMRRIDRVARDERLRRGV